MLKRQHPVAPSDNEPRRAYEIPMTWTMEVMG